MLSEVNLQPEVYSSVVLFLVLGALEEDEEEGEDEKTKIFSHFLNSESFSTVREIPDALSPPARLSRGEGTLDSYFSNDT